MMSHWQKVKKYFKGKKIQQVALIGVVVSGGMIGAFVGDLPAEFAPLVESVDCVSGEIFHSDEGVCVVDFNCEESGVCVELQNYLNEQTTVSLLDIIPERALHTTEDLFFETYGRNSTVLSQYEVSYGERAPLQRIASNPGRVPASWRDLQGDVLYHDELWELFSEITPFAIRSKVTDFTLVSDGLQGMLAAAEPDVDAGTWNIQIDILDASRDSGGEELIATLIHELAHIITLDTAQRSDAEVSECSGYTVDQIGCLQDEAYLSAYVRAFWTPAPFVPLYDASDPNALRTELTRRYALVASDYASPYSTMSPEEDIAESFIHFVLSGSEDSFQGLFQEKIDFFSSYTELMNLRTHIREKLLR